MNEGVEIRGGREGMRMFIFNGGAWGVVGATAY